MSNRRIMKKKRKLQERRISESVGESSKKTKEQSEDYRSFLQSLFEKTEPISSKNKPVLSLKQVKVLDEQVLFSMPVFLGEPEGGLFGANRSEIRYEITLWSNGKRHFIKHNYYDNGRFGDHEKITTTWYEIDDEDYRSLV